ncbi:type I restriction endonuclease [Rhodophyticola porphyridii]|uniref:Restriction endonuclease n=1 Tax=Rhodophyticola porphyridii TaxID=1852017 RepID=A0A3L9XX17_9RHOB|nr:type I restriction endonuclease [Rhodophyticola porphyridii]RMA41124.1 restriction endonuclease [Rhodophyticola porphyridii]
MSNLETSISALAERVRQHSETIQTEEAVKTSVVLPFLRALGYDVFNPGEVIPEFTADTPGKRGEKVDYAIKKDDEMLLLIECKGLSTQLNQRHLSQLFRYFTVTNTRFALLTNGREYQFFTDLDEPNRMDEKPFFIFDLLEISPSSISELNKFSKSNFSVDAILAQAERLRYVSATKRLLSHWFENPPADLVKLVASEVHNGRITSQVRENISKIVVTAFREIVRDQLQTRLSTALEDPMGIEAELDAPIANREIETTDEEREGFLLIKALLRGDVSADRVAIRDAKSYCAILLDDNNRKPLARLHFNGKNKSISLFDGLKEDRFQISSLDEIISLRGRLIATAQKYDN